MFNSNESAGGLAAELGGLDQLMALVRFVTDAKACGKRVEELVAMTTGAIEATAAAEQARAALAQATTEQEAALAKRKQEVDAYCDEALKKDRDADGKLKRVRADIGEMRRLDEQMRRAVMSYAGMLNHFNERIQDMPSWETLDRELLGKSEDAHFAEAEDGQFVTEPVEHAPAHASVRRSKRIEQRVQPDA
jgi:Mg2+ and Co2+ transporter CorA